MRARQVTVVMRGDDARLSGEPVAAFVRDARLASRHDAIASMRAAEHRDHARHARAARAP